MVPGSMVPANQSGSRPTPVSGTARRSRSPAGMQSDRTFSSLINQDAYSTAVLRLPTATTEDELDEGIVMQALKLGLIPHELATDIEALTSSLSATTVASDSNNQSSILSQATAPTSYSFSEHGPIRPSSCVSDYSLPRSGAPSTLSDVEPKRDSGFRRGIRRMATFKRRRFAAITLSASAIIDGDSNTRGQVSVKSDHLRSRVSIQSTNSSWSMSLSPAKSRGEQDRPAVPDTLQRSMECKQLLNLHTNQLDEKARFLEYQRSMLTLLHSRRAAVQSQGMETHEQIIAGQREKNDRAIENLETRQLEEEMKMRSDHQLEKRAVMVRLRYIEAHCQNPSPPPTPVDLVSGHPSTDSTLPRRPVTDKDRHNLAQQYRERDAMDDLHAARINVLRGKQKKAMENLMKKKEREIESLEKDQHKERQAIDEDFSSQEYNLRQALAIKRARLEARWKIQAWIERTKIERTTGLKYASLPDVVAVEEVQPISAA